MRISEICVKQIRVNQGVFSTHFISRQQKNLVDQPELLGWIKFFIRTTKRYFARYLSMHLSYIAENCIILEVGY